MANSAVLRATKTVTAASCACASAASSVAAAASSIAVDANSGERLTLASSALDEATLLSLADSLLRQGGSLALPDEVEATDTARAQLERDGQARLWWLKTPLDLFFSYTELHDACMERRRKVPFGDERIQILSAEDIALIAELERSL